MIGVICPGMVVTRADRRGRSKVFSLITGNRLQLLSVLIAKGGVCYLFW
jgi:hypothetical protein